MSEQLFFLERKTGESLQSQIQEMLVSLILDGHLPPGNPLPACRKLAGTFEVSRNTVVLVYERLMDEGYSISRQREGHFVNPELAAAKLKPARDDLAEQGESDELQWPRRFRHFPSEQEFLNKPAAWRQCRYAFIYGQLDPALFPAVEWRECSRKATSTASCKYVTYPSPLMAGLDKSI